MEEVIPKEEFNKLMKIEGEVKGSAIKEAIRFIFKEKGGEGIKKLEDTIIKLGYPKYREIKTMDFYPIGIAAITQIVIKRLFNFDDKKLQEMGKFEAKFSLIIRLLTKYLFSLEKAVKQVPEMWEKYYTVGDLKVAEYDEEKKYLILRLENFRVHPLFCQVLKGYFSSILQMIVRDEITCKETKCIFRGDEYDEFLLKW
ncbi:hypothetical protein KJA15_01115 [Patescibacteria group bacterium]|nr:hypothetical protein [Patescibacteria group bacterium]